MSVQSNHSLSSLLLNIVHVHSHFDGIVSGLSLDSRSVKPGHLFFALWGTQSDGRRYVNEAMARGAIAVLCEGEPTPQQWACHDSKVPVFFVVNLAAHVSHIVNRFYNYPSNGLKMIGVTGTNGKTSCTGFINQALTKLGQCCASIGTLGMGIAKDLKATGMTTPDAIQLQAQLAQFKKQQVQTVVMEVSSHGLEQGRVKGVAFDIGVFTNLSRDHLDYHGDVESYAAAKQRLFAEYPLQHAIINWDDDFGRQLIQRFKDRLSIYAFSLHEPTHDAPPTIWARHIEMSLSHTKIVVVTPWGEATINTSLLGHFNISNILAALTTLLLLDIPLSEAVAAITQLQPISGRMQTFKQAQRPRIVVDFAHTPDALAQVLKSLQHYKPKQLYCVFGCGGDRDQGKRPQMACIAERYAHKVIVTSDNPRSEDPLKIIADIMIGFSNPDKVQIEVDRKTAIAAAIQQATVEDIILIAGKGHEQYQLFAQQKLPFCDMSVARECLL